jgi:hypothetical protein
MANYLHVIEKDKEHQKERINIIITNRMEERLKFTTSHNKKDPETLEEGLNYQIILFKTMIKDFSLFFNYFDWGFKHNKETKLEFFIEPVSEDIDIEFLLFLTELQF